jgi:hypothetical protein
MPSRFAFATILCLLVLGRPASAEEPTAPAPVSVSALLDAVTELLDTTENPELDAEFRAFAARHAFPTDGPGLARDYRRLRLLFEATRDGGLWHLRWAITNQEPSSRRIWRQWLDSSVNDSFAVPSATAECDEVSALLGLLARRLAIKNVGLYYPTWNHTIAGWAPLGGRAKKSPLIMLPTTQIFLGCDAGFDNTSFKTSLTSIEAYPNWDIRQTTVIPQVRADWLLEKLRTYRTASPSLWALIRARRAQLMPSTMGACADTRSALAQGLATPLSEANRAVLETLGQTELQRPEASAKDILDWLAEP